MSKPSLLSLAFDADTKLRKVKTNDYDFLASLYANTRAQEVAQTGWDVAQQQSFLASQFQAQYEHYQKHFADAVKYIISWRNQPIGRLYVDYQAEEIRLIDIALLMEWQQRGIGSYYIKAILEQAQSLKLPVYLHVEQYNPAYLLYQRLGFVEVEDRGVYKFMRFVPDNIATNFDLKIPI